jgi:hypothetical protein
MVSISLGTQHRSKERQQTYKNKEDKNHQKQT